MIYVASSWRNIFYTGIVAVLKQANLSVYDFRHPEPGNDGFHWSAIDTNWCLWDTTTSRTSLDHPTAEVGFNCDMQALKACDRLVMVLPCGASSHLELGYAIGAGKPAFIYWPLEYYFEPELMYKAATRICIGINELLDALGVPN